MYMFYYPNYAQVQNYWIILKNSVIRILGEKTWEMINWWNTYQYFKHFGIYDLSFWNQFL